MTKTIRGINEHPKHTFHDRSSSFIGDGDGGEPPMNGLEKRVQSLEKDMRETRDAVIEIRAKHSTQNDIADLKVGIADLKAEMHSMLRQQIMWSIGAIIAAVGVAATVIKLIQ